MGYVLRWREVIAREEVEGRRERGRATWVVKYVKGK